MRTLNRPMFRYGGPIKEGVMNGIREPKRHGGSMGNNQGPRRAALVGNSAYPQTDGRAHHLAPLAIGAAAMRFLPAAYRGFKAARAFKPWSQNLGIMGRLKDTLLPSKGLRIRMGNPGEGSGFATGSILRSNPTLALTAGGYGIKKLLQGDPEKGPPTVSAINKQKRKIGMPENLTLGGGQAYKGDQPKELTEAEREAIEAENRIKQMKKYKEIMDIKGMKKDAVYKSLVDVSKQIQEGGSLKEQLKSGSLISNLTSAASKRFDKVSDTETALRSLVAKGEIENELNKETKALDKEYKQSAININKKKLAGSTLGEELSAYRTKNTKSASGATLKGFIEDKGGEVIAVADTVQVDKHIKGGGDAVSFMESIVVSNLENNKEVTPGIYVVKDTIIQIDENGKVTKVRP
jgi:hypothetical protein